MQPDLSVITLTIPGREASLAALTAELARQAAAHPGRVEHLVRPGPETYGEKMRVSAVAAAGRYVCWIDDDDWPRSDYLDTIISGVDSSPPPDVVTFGSATPPHRPAWLKFGARDDHGEEDGGNVRAANHYCAWRREVALAAPWLPRNYGAEYAWYTALRLAFPGLVEHHTRRVIHEYRYDPAGTRCQDAASIGRSLGGGRRHVLILRLRDGRLAYAVGRNQPDRGRYTVQLPDGSEAVVPKDQAEVLEEVYYR